MSNEDKFHEDQGNRCHAKQRHSFHLFWCCLLRVVFVKNGFRERFEKIHSSQCSHQTEVMCATCKLYLPWTSSVIEGTTTRLSSSLGSHPGTPRRLCYQSERTLLCDVGQFPLMNSFHWKDPAEARMTAHVEDTSIRRISISSYHCCIPRNHEHDKKAVSKFLISPSNNSKIMRTVAIQTVSIFKLSGTLARNLR